MNVNSAPSPCTNPRSLRLLLLPCEVKVAATAGAYCAGTLPCCSKSAVGLVFVDEELASELWVHEVFYGQNLIQGCFIQ